MKTTEQISHNMSRVRSSGSRIESVLGSALWAAGVRYRKQYRKIPGRPDFVVVRKKLAIFCDSAFWHGRNWPSASIAIKSNREFWIAKIEGNIRRDEAVNRQLADLGWRVIRFWDDEILKSTDICVALVLKKLRRKPKAKNDENSSG